MGMLLFPIVSLAFVALRTAHSSNFRSSIAGSCSPGRPFLRSCNVCWCTSYGTIGGCTNYKCNDGGNKNKSKECYLLRHCISLTRPLANKWRSAGKNATYIVNGQQAKLGQFPYQVFVKGDRRMICSGSLISEKAVLTAAHCTNSFKSFDLRMGGIHMVESESSAWIAVSSSAKRHPQYNSTGDFNNDVAVIFLPQKAPLNEYIKLVALPSFAEINETFVGQNALVSGWGLTGDNSTCSEILMWTELQVISYKTCLGYYYPGVILESTLCANSDYSDVCRGDSGGALVLKTATGYKQIGVSSFGSPGGCHTPTPSAFARVTSFLDWITKTAEISV